MIQPTVQLSSNLSKSLIIHDQNTQKITTVKEVWIPGHNLHRFWRFYSTVFSAFNDQCERLFQTLERVFHKVSKHLEVGKKHSVVPRFSTHFSVFEYPKETLLIVFDILHQTYTPEFNCCLNDNSVPAQTAY